MIAISLAVFLATLAPPTHPAVVEAQAIEQAEAGAQAIPDSARWPARVAWIKALRVPCPDRVQHIEALKPDGPGRDAEARLRHLRAAQIACKQSAAQTTKRLAIDYPTPGDDLSALSDDEKRSRARALEQQGEYAAARDLWQALGTRADQYEVARLALERFRTDFRAAAAQFGALIKGDDDLVPDAAYYHAKSLGRAGDLPAAMAAYDAVVKRFPTHKRAADARFFKAFSQYERAREPRTAAGRQAAYREAAKAFAAIEDASWKNSAAWYATWSRFLAGDAQAADFDALAADAKPGSQAHRKALYWAARADLPWHFERAAARYARLLDARVMDWYGLLVLRDFPLLVSHPQLPRLDASVPATVKAEVEEIRALMQAGKAWFARKRFADLRPALRKADALALEAQLAFEVGDAEDTLRHAAVKHQVRLRQPPEPEDAAAWHAAYPLAYHAIIEAEARRNRLPPALIHGFIRKESAYAPDAVSKAHAKGLMQLLPRTARRIQADRGLDPGTVNLFDPKTNITLGTWYVGALAQRYDRQLPLTMAAFNAGPGAVDSWRGAETTMETARWVDTIPFLQAREYVKRLTASLVVYGLVNRQGTVGELAAEAIPRSVALGKADGGVRY